MNNQPTPPSSTTKPPAAAAAAPPDAAPTVELTIRRRSVLRTVLIVCITCEVLFLLLDYFVNYGRLTEVNPIRNFVNTAREDALPSWFAITQTTLVALTVWGIYLVSRASEQRKLARAGWLVLAIFFSYMALDDGAEFHERMGSAFRIVHDRASSAAGEPTWGRALLQAFPSYSWQVIFVPLFAATGLFMLWFVRRQMRARSSWILVLVALSCFALAVGLDFFEGLDEEHSWNIYTMLAERPGMEAATQDRFGRDAYETFRHFSKSLEEVIEMFGMTLLWFVFLRHWMQVATNLRVRHA